eukprot:gnl/TRDRNA2_/TRDRNA2_82542_c0_seq1.p1 gnl/TRDRNA2_/TRDRNA2_82542_c0~~gnl/TRDRNA2_/TRDRNA2_82542_c0_seq1.p1  ORF type:complete len:224 (-),score=26.27 gnl/TRDRNA2_/TRDRNA2_82542_c0_seq1:68-703(-)
MAQSASCPKLVTSSYSLGSTVSTAVGSTSLTHGDVYPDAVNVSGLRGAPRISPITPEFTAIMEKRSRFGSEKEVRDELCPLYIVGVSCHPGVYRVARWKNDIQGAKDEKDGMLRRSQAELSYDMIKLIESRVGTKSWDLGPEDLRVICSFPGWSAQSERLVHVALQREAVGQYRMPGYEWKVCALHTVLAAVSKIDEAWSRGTLVVNPWSH